MRADDEQDKIHSILSEVLLYPEENFASGHFVLETPVPPPQLVMATSSCRHCYYCTSSFLDQSHTPRRAWITHVGQRENSAVSLIGTYDTSIGREEPTAIWCTAPPGRTLGRGRAATHEDEDTVASLGWSKDGAHIFFAPFDGTIRKWRSIDGEELIILRGHTNAVESLYLSPNESHLVSASNDYCVCIWDLKTNQPVGGPLLHGDELLAVVMSPDGGYIASAGKDAKNYVWNVEAALKQ
ncbi:WD40 repeat-like protein [Suillus weaverae]|nr:WD40 repeat-like protein [Suillus weaverae]